MSIQKRGLARSYEKVRHITVSYDARAYIKILQIPKLLSDHKTDMTNLKIIITFQREVQFLYKLVQWKDKEVFYKIIIQKEF